MSSQGSPRLLAWKGDAWIGEWRLEDGRTLRIGRSRDCEIFLDDEHVSRVHAEIRPVPGGWEVVDLGSTGGTRVDDVKTQRHRLRSGNRIQIGAIGLLAQDLDPAPERPAGKPAVPPGRTGIALALVASLAVLATAGFLLFRMRSRLPVALRTQPAAPAVTTAGRPPSAFSEPAIRALLSPSPGGAPRVTALGTFTTTSKGGRLETPLVRIDLPAGGLPDGSKVTVSRVDTAPAAMRASLPVGKWGKHAPISPIFDVDTGGRALAQPATISVPIANAAGLSSFTVQTWDPKTGAWDAFPARYDSGTGRVSANVRHFSLIIVIALVGGALAGERWIDYEYSKAAACVDSTGGFFSVCWRAGLPGGTRSYVTPGDQGPTTVTVPETVADLATALETAHAAYAAASLKLPGSKTWIYLRPFSAYAEFNAPALIGSPYILVDQASTTLLAQASAAHEYFHYVQHLYLGSKTSPWWREASAVAVETQLFPANLSWITDYYTTGSGTIEFASRLGRDESSSLYGYRVSLFSVFLARSHGGLEFQRRVLERHASQPILPSVAAALGGEAELSNAWLAFGRSLVGSGWGSYLSAAERQALQRQYDLKGLRLDPTRGALSEERPETPLSVFLYDVRILKNRLPENGKGNAPLLVRLFGGGKRALHVIAPGTGANSAPAPVNAPALSLIDRPVNVSLTGQDPAVEIREVSLKRANEVTSDLLLWLVDGERQESGTPLDVRITLLLPPANLRFDEGRRKLLWDAHPLAARQAKPAAPFDGYAVYRRVRDDSAPELLATVQDPEYALKLPDDGCARYAVAARLKAAEVRGTAESDKTEWLAVELKDPRDFRLDARLEPRSDGSARETGGAAKTVVVTASEAALGIRGLEIEATVAGETKVLYRKERTAEQQTAGTWQPEDPVLFTPPAPGTAYKVVARAWLLPQGHRCFDRARHFLEKVIAEEKGEAPKDGDEWRTIVQDSRFFKGPRSAVEVGIGTATCVGTAPTNLGKKTVLTFTELPKLDELKLDGEILLELKTKAEPGGPSFYAFYGHGGLVTSQSNVTVATGVKDGFLPEQLNGKWVPALERKTTDSLDWLVGGVMNFDKPRNRGGSNLTLLCQSGKPGPESSTSLEIRWTYPVDSLFQPKGAAPPATKLSDFAFNGRYRVQYELGDSKGVYLETVERDASGRLRTFQPASSITGNRADRGQNLLRFEGAVGPDGAFRYTHRLWSNEGRGKPAKEFKVESGEGRVKIVDGRTFRVEIALGGKTMTATYTRLP